MKIGIFPTNICINITQQNLLTDLLNCILEEACVWFQVPDFFCM